jgi:RNA polymerase sigma-70 factor (ECF subfamily)
MGETLERDEWLMGQVASGRAELLEPLVRRYGTMLLTFIRRMVGDAHRSEELFQDVFLAVWVKRDQYRFPMPFRPWLFKIAINKCRAAFRVKGLGHLRALNDEIERGADDGPVRTAIAAETATRIERAVAQLPAKQRMVLSLRIWNDLPYAEIAKILGVAEGTVRSNMHDALAAIRTKLEES